MSYQGVTIDNTDTYTQWGLILLDDLSISTPKLKSYFVDVPGADGGLDLSYALTGQPNYNNREISFSLFASVNDATLAGKYLGLATLCHGRRKKLWLPIDATHYYYGTFAIGDRSGFGKGIIPVTVDADPYAYKNAQTVVNKTVSGSASVTFSNEQQSVVPKITTTGAITITWGSNSVDLSAGTDLINPNIVLQAGNNTFTITGNSTVTFKYQEARL